MKKLNFGLVIRYCEPDFPDKEHFFVIVDYSPNKIPPMISLISSKNNRNKLTYVPIEEGKYDFFTKRSFIDCDSVYDRTPDELYELYSKGCLNIKGCLHRSTLEKIKDACYGSKRLAKYYKKRIVQAYNKFFE